MALKRKKESKWLIVENRKVHCYLCGRKMLKASQRIYDAQSGHYSHAICEKEKQLTGTNERRSAVKKIVAGAGVLGLTAVGVDKFTSFGRMSNSMFSSNAKDQTVSPDVETVITSQGIILPSLTSDPANPVAGQMWYRSDAGVTAHYNSIQNRVVYSSEINNGNVNVTSKGIVNGLSVLPNDGTGGFGPDTTLGATSVGEIGSPYTQTVGIKEAHDYAISVGIPNPNGGADHIFIPEIHILPGNYTISDGFTVSGNGNIIENYVFKGETSMAPWVTCNNTGFAITLDASSFNNSNIEVSNIQPQYGSDADGFITATLDSNGNPTLSGCPIAMYNMNIGNGGWNKYPIYLKGTTITLYNWQSYGNQAWLSGTSVSFFGGKSSGEYIYDTPMLQIMGMSAGGSYSSPGSSFTLNKVNVVSVFGGDMQYATSISFNLITNVNQISVIGFYTNVANSYQVPLLINNTGGTITVDYLYIRGLQTTTPSSLISNGTGSTTVISYPDIKYCNYTGLPIAIPTLSANPPVSGTVYENTNPYAIEIDLPVYATTSGTAGYVTIAKGSTDTPTAIGNQYVSGDTSSTATQIIRVRVPAGWYYSFTGSGVTFATATPFAE